MRSHCRLPVLLLTVCGACQTVCSQSPVDTKPLTVEGDLASLMVDGIDRFLLDRIARSGASRSAWWNRDMSSAAAYDTSIVPNRKRLSHLLGIRDKRISFTSPDVIGTIENNGPVAVGYGFKVWAIRWPVLADPAPTAENLPSIHGEGLLLIPDGKVSGNVIALPDADQSPEQICGLAEGVPPQSQFARRAAEAGFRVVVPALISRERSKRSGRANLTNREYLYRSAFELGRHLMGYELQKVLAIVDWFRHDDPDGSIGVIGYGEGGHLTLFAGALDNRIGTVCVSGAMGLRENGWQEPLDRNLFGLLREFGTGELAAMIQPRRLITDFTDWPTVRLEGNGGAPAVLETPPSGPVRDQLDMAAGVSARLKGAGVTTGGITNVFGDTELFCSGNTLVTFLNEVSGGTVDGDNVRKSAATPRDPGAADRSKAIHDRAIRQFEEIDRHNQALLRESPFVRQEFLKNLDTSSVESYEESVERYRRIFREDVIGEFDEKLLPFNARSRKSWETDQWTGHEVMLDVFPDVFAYGVLLLPKDLKPGEKRPVVVCQHGLEGRPTDTFLDDHRAYHDFAAKLCERGFITFAPQNPYIFQDRFRTLQRKANPLGKTLFSIIVPQHQQIVNWLKGQPYVDGDRIGFYGLSYGGKSAMRIPALVTDYCLSICSADFNEWVLKNASTREKFSYVWTGEYEIFEWDLGSTFNYFEMAALICPRPFMVERGHFDGVGEDHWVGYEYAKVRHLYAARLKIPERTEIEWFDGPHTINGQATFDFLHRHLNWPGPQSSGDGTDNK